MSDIPVQSVTRGAHEAPETDYDADTDYTAGFDSTTELAPMESGPDDIHMDESKMDELDSDPFADDLTKELEQAAPKKWVNRTTIAFAALVLVVGGFLGGIQVQKHYGKQSGGGTASAQDIINQLRNQAKSGNLPIPLGNLGGGRGQGGGFGGGAGGATGGGGTSTAAAQTGTIKLIDGNTIYISLPNGNVLTVKTNGSTKVTVSTKSSLKSLKAGQTVTVGGTPDSSGTVTATTVTASK
jgi:hypothetical protein